MIYYGLDKNKELIEFNKEDLHKHKFFYATSSNDVSKDYIKWWLIDQDRQDQDLTSLINITTSRIVNLCYTYFGRDLFYTDEVDFEIEIKRVISGVLK